jgi:hypothetical protein
VEIKRTVALLDVDHTLLFEDAAHKPILNQSLLDSLKAQEIFDIFLFTDMIFSNQSMIERKGLIKKLQAQDFRVHGVITPGDLVWNRLPEIEAKFLSENYQEKLSGEKFAEFINAQKRLPLTQHIISDKNFISDQEKLGQAFAEADCLFREGIKSEIESTSNSNPADIHIINDIRETRIGRVIEQFFSNGDLPSTSYLPPNLITKSKIAKALADYLSEKANNGLNEQNHTKGLLLELFLLQKPEWVDDILIADDHYGVINTIAQFKPVKLTGETPVITMLPIPHQNKKPLVADYYKKIWQLHQNLSSLIEKLDKYNPSLKADPTTKRKGFAMDLKLELLNIKRAILSTNKVNDCLEVLDKMQQNDVDNIFVSSGRRAQFFAVQSQTTGFAEEAITCLKSLASLLEYFPKFEENKSLSQTTDSAMGNHASAAAATASNQ